MLKQYNIDQIEKIINKNNETELIIRGWAVAQDHKCKIVLSTEKEEFIYPFNDDREDVIKALNLKSNRKVGFNFRFKVRAFSHLKVAVRVYDSEDIVIFDGTLDDVACVGEKNSSYVYNIEKNSCFIEEGKINVEVSGWAFNSHHDSELNIRIVDDKRNVIYEQPTLVEREDVKKAYSHLEVPLKTGFSIVLNVDMEVEYLDVYICEGEERYLVTEVEIPEYIKVNSDYIEQKIERLEKEYKRQFWNRVRNKKSALFTYGNYKKEYCQKLEAEKVRLREMIDLRLEEVSPYEKWVRNNKLTEDMIMGIKEDISQFNYLPKISIVMPVWNVKQKWLDRAIETIQQQLYTNWELCIADDCSTEEYIKPYLKQLEAKDKRIKVCFREKNGNISEATNSAVELVTGEYIFLMDNDDEIEINALYEIAKVLQDNKADIIYSDDDKIREDGYRYDPQFKPDWSPELLLSFMYFSHLFCMKTDLYKKVGGCRKGFEGCQDYDLALRVTEKADNIVHIPKVLYHWRSLEGSTALDGNEKPEAFERGIRAVQEALDRRHIKGKVIRPDFAVKSHLGIFSIDFEDNGPKVSIIIPTKNQKDLLKRCVDSIVQKTTYKNYEIIIINNESDDTSTIEYLDSLRSKHRVLDIKNKDGKFSYAYINNRAVEQAEGEFILFLNNDTEVIEPKWLSAMVGYTQIEDVGIVGARLLFPDNRVQHAGVVMGLYNGMVAPAFKLIPDYSLGYFNYARVTRNYSCVTAACLLMSKKLFMQIGGFDEENFAVAYNDVDLCIKCINSNKRVVYAAQAELYHYEGATRGFKDNIDEVLAFKRKYGNYKDKYYNVNLSLRNEQFNISPDCTNGYDRFVKAKTIVFATHNLNLEGAPLHLFELIKELKAKDPSNKIIVLSPAEGVLREAYEQLGVEVITIAFNINVSLNKKDYQKGIDEIQKIIEKENVNLIYANTLEMFYMIDVASKMNIPSIWNIHESVDYENYFKGIEPFVKARYLQCFISANKVIFVCQSTLQLYEKMNVANNFEYIYIGIDKKAMDAYKNKISKETARKKLQVEEDKKVVTIVGTVCERKGQLDLVKAIDQLASEQREHVEAYIVGCRQSKYLDKIKEYISAHELQNIHLIEETKDVYLYYRASDIFVCASNNESFPRVTLEAMCFELPIITTPVFGLKEQVLEHINGLYFEPGNINELSLCLGELIGDEEKYNLMKNNSLKVLALLNSYNEMIEKYMDIIYAAIR